MFIHTTSSNRRLSCVTINCFRGTIRTIAGTRQQCPSCTAVPRALNGVSGNMALNTPNGRSYGSLRRRNPEIPRGAFQQADSISPSARRSFTVGHGSRLGIQSPRLFSLWHGRVGEPESRHTGVPELNSLEEEVMGKLSMVRERCTGEEIVALGLVEEIFVNSSGE